MAPPWLAGDWERIQGRRPAFCKLCLDGTLRGVSFYRASQLERNGCAIGVGERTARTLK